MNKQPETIRENITLIIFKEFPERGWGENVVLVDQIIETLEGLGDIKSLASQIRQEVLEEVEGLPIMKEKKLPKHALCSKEFEINSGWYCNTHDKRIFANDSNESEIYKNSLRDELRSSLVSMKEENK